ncbi:MAG TPA: hypothetical protein VGO86_04200, partial [Candidatus Dormibacteraeota bacterium]
MRTLSRLFEPEAVVAGDQATAEMEPGLREATRLSADGSWWWDGRRWIATSTPDGFWRWDGRRWRPTIEAEGLRARDLATTLAFLAEERYARAAAILLARAGEWQPRGEPRALLSNAAAMRRRLLRAERAFAGGAAAPSSLLQRMRARPEDRRRIEDEQALQDTSYRTLMVRLGRHAPRPTVKEADDLLEMARLLDDRATRLTDALTAADHAERARARAIEAARLDVEAAEVANREAMESAVMALARAEEEREEERRAARSRLRATLEPPGEPVAEVGALIVRGGFVETPGGRLATSGLRAAAGSAVTLWRQRRDLLQDLVLLETAEAQDFLRCLSERRRDLFVLLNGRSHSLLWRCPPGLEKPLRQLVTAVNRRSSAAVEVPAQVTGGDDRTSEAVAAARQALGRVEAESGRALEAARQRLERAMAEPPELAAAHQAIASELRAVATPPRPLHASA